MRFILILSFLITLSISSVRADQADFFEYLPDLPLAHGLTELSDQAVIFEKPEGRIIQVVALVNASEPDEKAPLAFYESVLPAFGWKVIETNRFSREDETLELWTETHKKDIYFYVRIESKNL